MRKIYLALSVLLAAASLFQMAARATDANTCGYAQSYGGWYSKIDRSGPYSLDGNCNATLLGSVTQGTSPWTTNPNPTVGAASFLTGQWSNATASATQIAAARTGAPGTGRVSVTLYNSSSVNVFIGAAGVLTTTGIRILPGGSYTLYTTAAVFGVPASGTGTLDYVETY